MFFLQESAVYIIAVVAILVLYLFFSTLNRRKTKKLLARNISNGLDQPASLHPLIDPLQCIGCGTCVAACPEKNVLGLLAGKAELVTAANCVGHGACQKACPVGAIRLVFGTSERGVDIPLLDDTFQTAVPGIYIAGELGGMGLIRNAIEQGRQAVSNIASKRKSNNKEQGESLDLLIIGAGPAGIAASLAAKEKSLNYLTIEQDSLGGSVYHFPRAKLVMTAPALLPLVGKTRFRETSKEALLAFWQEVCRDQELNIQFKEQLLEVIPNDGRFSVETSKGRYLAESVLLCLGRRGTPRKLNIPGEDAAHVSYSLIDPEQFNGKRVIVIGGGDSALEAAMAMAEKQAAQVVLAYRGASFSRAKPANRNKVEQMADGGRLTLFMEHVPVRIGDDVIMLKKTDDEFVELPIDAVIICAGGVLPTPMLEKMGIDIETKYGTA